MNDKPTALVGMEVVTVAAHQTRKPGLRAVQAAGALLAGVLLSSCGQLSQESGAEAPDPGVVTNNETPPAGNDGGMTQPDTSESGGASESPRGGESPSVSDSTEGNDSSQGRAEATEQHSASGVERCHTSMLSGDLRPGDPGAGQRYAELVLTNNSAETCTLFGYGGLQLVDSNGAPLSTDLTRDANPGPTMIKLAPSESASKTLHWSSVPHGDEPTDGPCQPAPSGAQVIPPDETDPVMIGWKMGPVCGFGSIDGTAYHA